MNPGTTSRPPASTGVTFEASLRISSVIPTAAIRSPLAAIASTHGAAGSPVHTRALTMASVIGPEPKVGGGWVLGEQAAAMTKSKGTSRRFIGMSRC
jgi:hypothetical protein